ncbi:probably inactive leucine-rich repeat receptor-like protein kinase At5g48380 [Quercus suber]|uniref:probably inactive leucine-rich repeat receptor-like protein kinase At5g48380 n=1 Tax=Quercus suber TaxID=58331 RepID=UPI000CE16AEC|nr:probably inactive leucine-rich repeat receptor-like protein kinase At5g48380 [Quercus suber]POE98444.1 putative inactive leucine-rich repeat receptor-like protein kinase [Quercus suber]
MARNSGVLRALFHIIFVWSFLNALEISNGTETDIYCLKSIKDSLEDPYNRLKDSWDFSNKTEGSICRFTGVECWHPNKSMVLNIRLSDMMLRGHFPRGIKNCSSLTGLDLSGNELSGPLPFDIAELLPFVTSLELSVNKFSGEIPKSIGNCSYLNVLKLDNNQLTGEIPPEMSKLKRLKLLDVSNNQLSGSVPVFDSEFITAESFANNEELCGRPLKPCPRWIFDFSFKSGFLVGYVFSTVSLLVIFFSQYAAFMNKKKTAKKMTLSKEDTKNAHKEADQFIQSQTKGLLQEGSKKNSQLEGMVTKMNFTELSEATTNFSTNNALGLGKIGVMYKGTLPNGSLLAVKRLHGCQSFEKQFICELLALGTMRHNNIVPLLGFCRERKEKLLVYQYISNGNLYDWLHVREGNDKILEWPLRIKIAMGIARGLAWLHHKCDFRVLHLNLSSNCILLDNNFEPKISNFGGAKISTFEGAMFMDSNETDSSNSSFVDHGVWELGFVKKDVYDFGVVLLELITGNELIQINNYPNSLCESLVDWITHLLTSSYDVYNVIDKSLIGQGFDGEIFQFLRIACTFLKPFPAQRPTMLELYNMISILGERYGITNDSEILRQSEIATASTSNEIVEVEIT